MMFINQFKRQFPFLIEEDFNAFFSITTKENYKKGQKVIDFGEQKKKVALITEGIVRSFIINSQGKEFTTFLFQESQIFAPYETLIRDKPSNQIFECLEPTKILMFEYKDFQAIAFKNDRIKKVMDSILFNNLLIAIKRNESFIMEKPEQRYLSFLKNHGDLLGRVPQKHVASFLGITAVSFSRLKKRIYDQQIL